MLPGRVRFRLENLKTALPWNPLRDCLSALEGVASVRTDALTGSILIFFHAPLSFEALHRSVREAVTTAFAESDVPGPDVGSSSATHPSFPSLWAMAQGLTMAGIAMFAGIGWALGAVLIATVSQRLLRRFIPGSVRNAVGERAFAELRPALPTLLRGLGFGFASSLAGLTRVLCIGAGVAFIAGGLTPMVFGLTFGSGTAVAICCLGMVSFTLVRAAWRLESQFSFIAAGREIQHRLRIKAFDHVLRLDMTAVQTATTAQLCYSLVEDVNQTERLIDSGAQFALLVSEMVVYLIAVAALDLALVVLAMLILFLQAFLMRRLVPSLRKRYEPARAVMGQLNARLSGAIEGLAVIRAFGAEDTIISQAEATSRLFQDRVLQEIPAVASYPAALDTMVLLAVGAASFLTASGPSALTYTTGLLLVSRLFSLFGEGGPLITDATKGLEAFGRVVRLLELPQERKPAYKHAPVIIESGIVFDRVSLRYPGGAYGMRDVSLHFKARRKTAVVGLTGSGKSSIVNVLLGFFGAERGRVLVDGKDFTNLDPEELRRRISVVGQNVYLFPCSIAENIGIGRPSSTMNEIVEAARLASAEEFIEELPQGYQTIVGERGETLSGGQRQRITIARALLKNAPVLVLDEATSSLDNITRRTVLETLDRFAAGRTTIVIDHDLSAISNADYCYVLDHGKVVQEGTHATLLENSGYYSRLWNV